MRGFIVVVVGMVSCSSTDIVVGPPGSSAIECDGDRDCVATAVRCCDCPTFAVPVGSPSHRACADVKCPQASCPDNVRVACDAGRCILACVAMECAQSCLHGFASDGSGCLTCTCAEPVASGCVQPADCARVRADCCGCEHGGHDTAVLERDAAAFEANLRCPARPQCPRTATCDPAASVQCIQGRCALTAAAALPAGACGRLDLPPCAPQQVCVVNADSTANEQGVGVCRPDGP